MTLNMFSIIRFCLALLSVCLILLQPKIPLKKVVLHPQVGTKQYLYGRAGQFRWTDEYNSASRCEYEGRIGGVPCGFILEWGDVDIRGFKQATKYPLCTSKMLNTGATGLVEEEGNTCFVSPNEQPACSDGANCEPTEPIAGTDTRGNSERQVFPLDFSGFDGIYLTVHYEGRAQQIDVRLHGYEPSLSVKGVNSDKVMSAFLQTIDLKAGPAFIKFSDFLVPEWWVWEKDVNNHMALPDFSRIVSFSINNSANGIHNMRVDRIELVGERLTLNQLLVILAIFWSAYIICEAMFRYIKLYLAEKKNAAMIELLRDEASNLEVEKTKLEAQSISDPLTGILNRAGALQKINSLSGIDNQFTCCLMIIDIDHFKKINDTYGHEVGDKIIKALADLVSRQIRTQDVFARWGGEEFLLMSCYTHLAGFKRFAEKLRKIVAEATFDDLVRQPITVSIGVAMGGQGDDFRSTFKRADIALYKAKATRNTVCSEEV